MPAGVLDDGDEVMNKLDVVLFSISLQSNWGDKQLQYKAVEATMGEVQGAMGTPVLRHLTSLGGVTEAS